MLWEWEEDYEKKKKKPCKKCKEYESDDECDEYIDNENYSKPKVINCKPKVIVRKPKIIQCEPTIIKYKPEIIKCRSKIIKWYKPKITHHESKTKKIGCEAKVTCWDDDCYKKDNHKKLYKESKIRDDDHNNYDDHDNYNNDEDNYERIGRNLFIR